jgi:hypothetical protein
MGIAFPRLSKTGMGIGGIEARHGIEQIGEIGDVARERPGHVEIMGAREHAR